MEELLISFFTTKKQTIEMPLEKPEELAILERIFEDNQCSSIKQITKMNPTDIAIAVALSKANGEDVEKLVRCIKGFDHMLNTLPSDGVDEFLKLLDVEPGEKKIIARIIGPSNKRLSIPEKLTQIALKKALEKPGVSLECFLDAMELYGENLHRSLYLASLINELKSIYEKGSSMIREEASGNGFEISKRYEGKLIKDAIKQTGLNLEKIESDVQEARKYYENKARAFSQEQKRRNKQVQAYEALIGKLSKLEGTKEITNIDDLLDGITDEEERKIITSFVYLANLVSYQSLMVEYGKISRDAAHKYESLLEKYSLPKEMYDIDVIMQRPFEELEEMLSLLSQINISSKKLVVDIISNSTLENTSEIASLVRDGILTEDFLSSHPKIFMSGTKENKNFKANMKTYQENGYNPHMLENNNALIISEPSTLTLNLRTMTEYDLQKLLKAGNDLSFLSTTQLQEAIDTLLELGYEEILDSNIEVLNHSAKFNRLVLANRLNIPLETEKDVFKVLNAAYFVVPDGEIQDSISPAEYCQNKAIRTLDHISDFDSTSRTYEIDGVKLSKNRIARNQERGLTPLDSLLAGTTISDEELKIAIKGIKEKQYQK